MHFSAGFTLIEVLLALAVVGVSFGSIFSLLSASVKSSTNITNQLIAANLAQEGLEIIRNIRDSNYVASRAWDEGFDTDGCLSTSKACEVAYDIGLTDITPDDVRLKLNDIGGYSYIGVQETPFIRSVFLNRETGEKIRVRVEVSWEAQGQSSTLTAETLLYDWK